MSPSDLTTGGLIIQNVGNMAMTETFQKGYCTIQDESSMLVGLAVAPKPGMNVLDTCAAPGGKTTHLAELMNNDGSILALDIHNHKLSLIEDNARRLGLSIIHTKLADARELPDDVSEEGFERILIDAPCSGFGVIRRKPDLKWNKTVEDIAAIAETQSRILEQAAKRLKPGGKLVYSTCTLDPEENHKMIFDFLDKHPQFELDSTLIEDLPVIIRDHFHKSGGYVQLLPHYFGSDGFFISRLVRNS